MTFKQPSQLFKIIEQNGLKKVSNTDGGEWVGPCSKCGGSDRFHVWPEKDRFWCRKCDAKGDSIAYLQWTEGKTFREACQIVGKVLKRRGLRPIAQDWREEISLTPPTRQVVVAETKEIEADAPGEVIATVDDIQVDAPTEISIVADTVQEAPVTTVAVIPDPKVIAPLPEPISSETLIKVISGYVIDFWGDLVPAAVVQYDCWGGCIHYKHWKDSYLCHQLTGDVDLTASGVKCPVQELPDNRLRLPVLSASGISPEDCKGCHWLGGTLDSQACISVDVKLKSLGDCPGFEQDRDDWILTTGLEPLPAV
jgi:hypothetical protein